MKIPAGDLKSITNILNQGVHSHMTRKEKQERKKKNLEDLRSTLISLKKNQTVSSKSSKIHVRHFIFEKGKSRSLLTGGTENNFDPDASGICRNLFKTGKSFLKSSNESIVDCI